MSLVIPIAIEIFVFLRGNKTLNLKVKRSLPLNTIYPLPNLPPRGKERIYLSPLGENERGYFYNILYLGISIWQ
jgi:hypothetical protein